jgi:hypothetical protein
VSFLGWLVVLSSIRKQAEFGDGLWDGSLGGAVFGLFFISSKWHHEIPDPLSQKFKNNPCYSHPTNSCSQSIDITDFILKGTQPCLLLHS